MNQVSNDSLWTFVGADDPIVATAIHDGHDVRAEVAAGLAISETERLREEDPFTGRWAEVAPNRIVAKRSRFEVDLNRPRDKAVYVEPEDAWGLHVWRDRPQGDLIARSLADYDAFYARVHEFLDALVQRFGVVVVLDLHTYNHRREGPNGPVADPEANPEVNIGTGTLDRARFAPIADRLIQSLREADYLGRHLDVRENVKFRGGHFSRWIHEAFPGSVAVLAIEFKKIFMDELTGKLDPQAHQAMTRALSGSLPGLRETARKLAASPIK